MARFIDFQTNFSTGELDPLLRARVDIPQYDNALAKATNAHIVNGKQIGRAHV